ncbi:sodium/proline symporter PutP [Salisediminibacterium halotolerans]|uniref:Sodium/proline symporter n=1 Tax=Salisediminibacterium halotolerans TaxID=517425 RepID=A0A1H9TUD6_9BACI|nr:MULTISPECIES: sodium/proline symporter PutP [Salisediminibacterium]RLJ75565.1 sodium/proline symporter [Actinophytocola xinjiangensis]RPE89418.1 sodium/proline symporter [Salisediminibacterium halotolerans]TWG36178.1 sodium/proline symporter [Salisediminibacterium halotolerans]SES00709.1 sodium/proline symporter [Salisediminibacterium haloalkalitolerans]GEL08580.1 sodium:proline symporter [Salisediminibacterium halotolerans]
MVENLTPILTTFVIYLIGMMVLGLIAYRMTDTLSDYVLGGRRLGAGVAALSAGASDMSSWLLLGLPGALYLSGLVESWIAIGLAVGAVINWMLVAGRLRAYTEVANDSITLPDFFENRFNDTSRSLRIVSALALLVFFTFYTSSGLVGGAVLFESTFGIDQQLALYIGALIIIGYTFLGGFLAVSWTDFVQGILMFLALIIIPIWAIMELGGIGPTFDQVRAVDPQNLELFGGVGAIGIISLLGWGLGYFGQPHIIVRFMSIKSMKELPKAQGIGITWVILSMTGAVMTGLVGIAYFADAPLDNHETVFLMFTQALFHPVIAGILLAAVLAAIMSTIDSQLLVSSSALAEDIYKGFIRKNADQKELVLVGRLGVLTIAVIALILAQDPDSTVLELVSYAWAGLGATFGPVVVFSLFWKRMTRGGALAGLISGALTVWIWVTFLQTDAGFFSLYELVVGFVVSSIMIVVFSLLSKPPEKAVLDTFEKARAMAKGKE